MIPDVVATVPNQSQLEAVLGRINVILPFNLTLSSPDGARLEVGMYVVDRDYHLRIGTKAAPQDRPYVRQILSFDMSDEVLALGQKKLLDVLDGRHRRYEDRAQEPPAALAAPPAPDA